MNINDLSRVNLENGDVDLSGYSVIGDKPVEVVRQSGYWAVISVDVMHDKKIPLVVRGFYSLLCTYANKEGDLWPSNRALAEIADVSERTIQRYYSDLIDAGVIGRITEYYKNGITKGNKIIIIDKRERWEAKQNAPTVEPSTETTSGWVDFKTHPWWKYALAQSERAGEREGSIEPYAIGIMKIWIKNCQTVDDLLNKGYLDPMAKVNADNL